MTFESNISRDIEEITVHRNVDTLTIRDLIDTQLEDLREGKLIDINLESGCEEKAKDIPEEVMLAKNIPIEGTLRAIS